MNIENFKKLPILGILRGINRDDIESLAETVISAGLKTIEIAMNTDNAASLINEMVIVAKGRLTVGAGTVLNTEQLKQAIDAGATFIVSPTFIEDVVSSCVKKHIPVFPGAFTPTEIYHAWKQGATMVKVFPAKFFGPGYFREIKGPFREIPLLACGGVTEENIGLFFQNQANAVAFGASIFKNGWIQTGQFHLIKEKIEALIDSYTKNKAVTQ